MSDCVISITEYMHVILIRKFPTSVCMIKFSRISKSFAESQIFFLKVDFSNFWLFFALDQVESFRYISLHIVLGQYESFIALRNNDVMIT